MGALFSSPKSPTAPPPPPPAPPPAPLPDANGTQVTEQANNQRRKAAAALGLGSTVLTGPGGLMTPASTTQKNLTGG